MFIIRLVFNEKKPLSQVKKRMKIKQGIKLVMGKGSTLWFLVTEYNKYYAAYKINFYFLEMAILLLESMLRNS